jgi:hypothetical protein
MYIFSLITIPKGASCISIYDDSLVVIDKSLGTTFLVSLMHNVTGSKNSINGMKWVLSGDI